MTWSGLVCHTWHDMTQRPRCISAPTPLPPPIPPPSPIPLSGGAYSQYMLVMQSYLLNYISQCCGVCVCVRRAHIYPYKMIEGKDGRERKRINKLLHYTGQEELHIYLTDFKNPVVGEKNKSHEPSESLHVKGTQYHLNPKANEWTTTHQRNNSSKEYNIQQFLLLWSFVIEPQRARKIIGLTQWKPGDILSLLYPFTDKSYQRDSREREKEWEKREKHRLHRPITRVNERNG